MSINVKHVRKSQIYVIELYCRPGWGKRERFFTPQEFFARYKTSECEGEPQENSYLFEFIPHIPGHNGKVGNAAADTGSCWWLNRNEFKIIRKATKEEIIMEIL